MRLDRQHIAELGDRIDLEALGVADDHRLDQFSQRGKS
jgi:hypothetical protein